LPRDEREHGGRRLGIGGQRIAGVAQVTELHREAETVLAAAVLADADRSGSVKVWWRISSSSNSHVKREELIARSDSRAEGTVYPCPLKRMVAR
jgi:hypothetical protein